MSTTRAALYLRQSLDRAGDGAAVSRQEEDARALCAARGWEVAGVYRDNDASAARPGTRPAFERLLSDLTAGLLDAVVAWDMTRLTRNRRDTLRVVEVGQAQATVLAFCRGSDLDLSTPAGRLVADLLAAVSRQEIDQKGDRQRRALAQRAAAGKADWGPHRPYGFERGPDGSPAVVAVEADHIRWAAEQVRAGASLAHTARALGEMGSTTSLGQPWSTTSLRRVLLSPRLVPGGVLLAHERDALAQILAAPSRRLQSSTAPVHLLSGLAVCGVCGGRMVSAGCGQVRKDGSRRPAYKCQGHRHLHRACHR